MPPDSWQAAALGMLEDVGSGLHRGLGGGPWHRRVDGNLHEVGLSGTDALGVAIHG